VMEMTIYADALFLVNFIMNGFVLWVLSKLISTPRKFRWILLGSAVMSLLYTLLIIIEAFRGFNIILSSLFILTVGVLTTFHPKNIKSFLKLIPFAYAISFTVGGLGMALFFLTDIPYAIHYMTADWEGLTRAISWQLVLMGTVISYVFIKILLFFLERLRLKRQMFCIVDVIVGDEKCSFNALVDTGHSLKDPISKTPVIIAEFDLIKNLLPDGIKIIFYEKKEANLVNLLPNHEENFYKRIRLVPFSSLGKSNGILIGFRPDKVHFNDGEKSSDAIIGIYNEKLSKNGTYSGLLSPELVA